MEIEEIGRRVAARRRMSDGTARTIRQRAGLTQADMAEAVGVSEATVSRWENRQRQPRGAALMRWAAVLNELESITAPDDAA